MKCVKCGSETGASWKKLCIECYKESQRKLQKEQEDRNYLNVWESGNIQNDLDFSEDNFSY